MAMELFKRFTENFIPQHVTMSGGVANAWTDMPAALSEYFGVQNRTRINLSRATQVKFELNCIVAGATNAVIRLQYSTDNSSFNSILASGEAELGINTTGHKELAFTNLATGAKANNIYLRIVGINGDAVADPWIGNIYAQFI